MGPLCKKTASTDELDPLTSTFVPFILDRPQRSITADTAFLDKNLLVAIVAPPVLRDVELAVQGHERSPTLTSYNQPSTKYAARSAFIRV